MDAANPGSAFPAGGRIVELKAHGCVWSGAFAADSPLAIEECARERVLRAELDVRLLRDGAFLVFHDERLDDATDARGRVRDATAAEAARARLRDGAHPLLLPEAVELLARSPFPRRVELDLKDDVPYTRPQAEALARAVRPAKDRLLLGGTADENLRRLRGVDPTLLVSLDPQAHLDVRDGSDGRLPVGAYGYRDAHPLATRRRSSVAEYLRQRFGVILRLVGGLREAHLRLELLERMLDDGVPDAAEIFHRLGVALDVWTLDAGTPRWRERLARAVAAGVDVVTTSTAPALADAGRALARTS